MLICFDLWNTLIRSLESTGASYADVLISLGAPQPEIYPFVRDHLMVKELTYQEMVNLLFSHFGLTGPKYDSQRQEAIRVWQQDNQQVDWLPRAQEVLHTFRGCQGVTLVLITNITKPAWDAVNQKLELSQLFDYSFLSCSTGFSKPDPRVWKKIEERYPQVQPQLMIGDNATDDLLIPSQRGWQTFLVQPDGSNLPTLLEKTP